MINALHIPGERKYWFVRSGNDGGKYFRNFKENNVVALGHADNAELDIENNTTISDTELEAIINGAKRSYQRNEDSRSSISSKTNQLKRFLTEIKKDDIIITVTSDRVLAGKVISDCYYSTEILSTPDSDDVNQSKDCRYAVRYDMDWGSTKKRDMLPFVLEKSFKYTGSVLSISDDEQIKALNHWLFPIHYVDNQVRCSLKINSQNELSNRQLSRLSSIFDEIELLATYIESNESNFNFDGFIEYSSEQADNYNYTLTAQHLFMSPGHQFLQLSGSDTKKALFAIIFAALFNTQVAFADTDSSAYENISSEDIQLIVSRYKEVNRFEAISDSLSINLPTEDVNPGINEYEESSEGGLEVDDLEDAEPDDSVML
ncbi:putative uncharacterized phage protein [Aliivibrio wodanis]|uniref:Uncharacterized phage protein n=1 Tax=Aliivibrio wodanis TaxID=80852 RepID=A0A090I629_9GAMM|nr:putative uncharacterized phage protein [Aliivibrio wodanis]